MLILGASFISFADNAPIRAIESALANSVSPRAPSDTAVILVGYGGPGFEGMDGADFFSTRLTIENLGSLGYSVPFVLNHACASTLFALNLAHSILRAGELDRVVIAGTLEPSLFDEKGMRALGVISEHGARPFQRDRDGTQLGSGQHALVVGDDAGGGQALATVCSVVCQIWEEPKAGLDRISAYQCMTAALDAANVVLPDMIEAHATGTRVGDAAELAAIELLSESRDGTPRVNASKASHGHLLHGAGTVSIVSALDSIRAGDTVLVNAFGFGGNYASAVLMPPPDCILQD